MATYMVHGTRKVTQYFHVCLEVEAEAESEEEACEQFMNDCNDEDDAPYTEDFDVEVDSIEVIDDDCEVQNRPNSG